MSKTKEVIRWVVTHIGRSGERVMTSRQCRFTYATEEEAEHHMHSMLTNQNNDIAGAYGEQAIGTFEVRAVPCWPSNFDPKVTTF